MGKITGAISADELTMAEALLILEAQKMYSPDESAKIALSIFRDKNGVLRCRGNLERSINFDYNTKFSIFLPHNAPLTGLVLFDLHLRLRHAGPNSYRNCAVNFGYHAYTINSKLCFYFTTNKMSTLLSFFS